MFSPLRGALQAAPLLLLLCLAPASQALAQSDGPYYLSWKKEATYLGGGTLTLAASEWLRTRIKPVPIHELPFQELSDIDGLTFVYTDEYARRLSDKTMYASAGLGLLLTASSRCRKDAGIIGLLFAETMLLNQGLTNLSKAAFRRPRPYVFNPEWDVARPVLSGDRSSLISGHTSGAAAGAFFFARVFADYHPESKLRPYVWGLAATLPALTGYLRVRAAKHYPSDVLAGYALGAAVGYLVPTLHKRPLRLGNSEVRVSGTGIRWSYKFK